MDTIWSETPGARRREIVADLATSAWVSLWVVLASRLYTALAGYAEAGRALQRGGTSLQAVGGTISDALAGVPLVGEGIGSMGRSGFEAAGEPFIYVGGELEDLLILIAGLLGALVLAVTLIPWLSRYLPWRARRLADLRHARRAIRRRAPTIASARARPAAGRPRPEPAPVRRAAGPYPGSVRGLRRGTVRAAGHGRAGQRRPAPPRRSRRDRPAAPLRLGLNLPYVEGAMDGATPRWADILAMAPAAERVGFDCRLGLRPRRLRRPGRRLERRLGVDGRCSARSPPRRRGVELGTYVRRMPLRNPALLAKRPRRSTRSAAGGSSWASAPAGTSSSSGRTACPFDRRFDRFEDGLRIITSMLRTGRATHDGRVAQRPIGARSRRAGRGPAGCRSWSARPGRGCCA